MQRGYAVAARRERVEYGGGRPVRWYQGEGRAHCVWAYVTSRIGFFFLGLACGSLKPDHAWRVTKQSTMDSFVSATKPLPWRGIIPRGKPEMSRLAKVLWIVLAAMIVSDLLPTGPVDLGLLPDIHLLHLLGAHGYPTTTAGNRLYDGLTSTPHFLWFRLPWHDLYPSGR